MDTAELDKGMRIGKTISLTTTRAIWSLIVKYWDCFCAEGAKCKILDYEFGIDTGVSRPICCRKPAYGPHKGPVIMDQIESLLDNDWTRKCGGPWGSQIVSAAKPHQDHIDNIKNFVRRICVSYRSLNKITKIYEYPVPRCDMAVTVFQMVSYQIHWIIICCQSCCVDDIFGVFLFIRW